MFVVHAHITVGLAQRARFLDVMGTVIRSTREEPGNHRFEMTADLSDPSRFTLFEHWESDEALAAHMRQPYFRSLLALVPELGFSITGTTYFVDRVETAQETLRRVRHDHRL